MLFFHILCPYIFLLSNMVLTRLCDIFTDTVPHVCAIAATSLLQKYIPCSFVIPYVHLVATLLHIYMRTWLPYIRSHAINSCQVKSQVCR